MGVEPWGVSFHVGSQQKNPAAWEAALAEAAGLFRDLEAVGIELGMVNLGGGFPTPYRTAVPDAAAYGCEIMAAVRRQFGNRIPFLIAEPGRGLVGNAGVIQTEVVLIAAQGRRRRAALGLSRRRQVRRPRRDHGRGDPVPDRQRPHRRADAGDPGRPDLRQRRRALRAQPRTRCREDLEVGDRLEIGATGAYTTTYAAVGFNGFDPLRAYCI